jgi:hypothetical protein
VRAITLGLPGHIQGSSALALLLSTRSTNTTLLLCADDPIITTSHVERHTQRGWQGWQKQKRVVESNHHGRVGGNGLR